MPTTKRDCPRQILVLQGGGALGAYQAGVYEALGDQALEPDWLAGISIGAINAASSPAIAGSSGSTGCTISGTWRPRSGRSATGSDSDQFRAMISDASIGWAVAAGRARLLRDRAPFRRCSRPAADRRP